VIGRREVVGAAAAMILARPAWAGLAAPRGKPILTVDGKITQHNVENRAQFDIDMLDMLPQGRFYGETPWTRGKVRFTGPLLSAVLDAAGATGDTLEVTALNDYFVIVPAADARTWPVIVATRRDGAPMSIRDKGPLWLIYPMDTVASLRTEAIYARSAWQLARITVV
jgi:hypothetical protein